MKSLYEMAQVVEVVKAIHNDPSWRDRDGIVREWKQSYPDIPRHMLYHVWDYVMTGHGIGDFLHALFSNELVETWGRADNNNQRAIGSWVMLVYNRVPCHCWGSRQHVKMWMDAHDKCR